MPGYYCKACGIDTAFLLKSVCKCDTPLAFTLECPQCKTAYTSVHTGLFCLKCLGNSNGRNEVAIVAKGGITITPVLQAPQKKFVLSKPKDTTTDLSLSTTLSEPKRSPMLLTPSKGSSLLLMKRDKERTSLISSKTPSKSSEDREDLAPKQLVASLQKLKSKYGANFKKVLGINTNHDVHIIAKNNNYLEVQDASGHSLDLVKCYLGNEGLGDVAFYHPDTVLLKGYKQSPNNHLTVSGGGGSEKGDGCGMAFIRAWDSSAEVLNTSCKAGKGVTVALVMRHSPKFVPDEIMVRFYIDPPVDSGKKKLEIKALGGCWGYKNTSALTLDHLLVMNIPHAFLLEVLSIAMQADATFEDLALSRFMVETIMINVSDLETNQKDKFGHEGGFPKLQIPGLTLAKTRVVRGPTTYTQLSKGKSVFGLDTKYPKLVDNDCKIVSSIEAEAEFCVAPSEANEAVLEMLISLLWDAAGFDTKGEKNWWDEITSPNKSKYGFHEESWLNDGNDQHLTINGLDGWKVYHVPKYWKNFEKKFWNKTVQPSSDPFQGIRMYHRPVFDGFYEPPTVMTQDLVPLQRKRYCNPNSEAGFKTKIPMMMPWPLCDFYLDTPGCLILSNGGSLRIRDNARGGDLVNVKGLAVKIDSGATVRYCANLDLKAGAGKTLFHEGSLDQEALAQMKDLVLDPATIAVHDCLESVLAPIVRKEKQCFALTEDVRDSGSNIIATGTLPSPGWDVYDILKTSQTPCPLACRLKVVSERHRFVFQAPMNMGGAKIELSFDLSYGSVGQDGRMVLGMEFGLEHMGRSMNEMTHEEPTPTLSLSTPSPSLKIVSPQKSVSSLKSGPRLVPVDNRLYDPYDLSDPGISDVGLSRNKAFLYLRDCMLGHLDEMLDKNRGTISQDATYVKVPKSQYLREAGYKANQLAMELGLTQPLLEHWSDRRFDREDILERPLLPEATPRLRDWT